MVEGNWINDAINLFPSGKIASVNPRIKITIVIKENITILEGIVLLFNNKMHLIQMPDDSNPSRKMDIFTIGGKFKKNTPATVTENEKMAIEIDICIIFATLDIFWMFGSIL